MNRISLIIPSYQHVETVGDTLDAAFAQTRPPDEVIVVNDGSTDRTAEVLDAYAGRIMRIDQENRGGNVARNRGFEASSGDFVLFCDADVVMRPDMLQKMETALLEHPEAGYAYSGFRFGWKSFPSFPFDDRRLRRMNFIHTTSLVRRTVFPGFDPEIRRLQDWDVWLTMLAHGHPGFFIDEELFFVQDAKGRKGISQWRPSCMYLVPWGRVGWIPESMRRYHEARKVILEKHGL